MDALTEAETMRASHIKPWAKCETDAERLDVYYGATICVRKRVNQDEKL